MACTRLIYRGFQGFRQQFPVYGARCVIAYQNVFFGNLLEGDSVICIRFYAFILIGKGIDAEQLICTVPQNSCGDMLASDEDDGNAAVNGLPYLLLRLFKTCFSDGSDGKGCARPFQRQLLRVLAALVVEDALIGNLDMAGPSLLLGKADRYAGQAEQIIIIHVIGRAEGLQCAEHRRNLRHQKGSVLHELLQGLYVFNKFFFHGVKTPFS